MQNVEKIGDALYEAVTVAETKAHCFVYHNADDFYLDGLRTAAREQVERDLNMAVVGQTYTLHTEATFPSRLRVPIQPVSSITSIEYTDADGDTATLEESFYSLKAYRDPPEVEFTGTLPVGTDVTVTFVAGFPLVETEEELPEDQEPANTVPQLIRQAILFLVKGWYDGREPVISGTVASTVPLAYERIISRLRVSRFR